MVKPLIIQTRRQWEEMLADALACTEGGRLPNPEERERTSVGPIAARNLEEEDETYATWLEELDYAFRGHLDRLP